MVLLAHRTALPAHFLSRFKPATLANHDAYAAQY